MPEPRDRAAPSRYDRSNRRKLELDRERLRQMARRLRTSPVGEREVAAAAFAEFFALVGASLFEREEEYLLSRRGGTKAPTLAKVFIDHIEITQLVGLMADDAREGVADPTLLERIAHRVERHLAFETGTIGGGVARPFRGCRRLS